MEEVYRIIIDRWENYGKPPHQRVIIESVTCSDQHGLVFADLRIQDDYKETEIMIPNARYSRKHLNAMRNS